MPLPTCITPSSRSRHSNSGWPLEATDTLSVFFNGKRLLHEAYARPAAADQDFVDVSVKEGKNELLVKICQGRWRLGGIRQSCRVYGRLFPKRSANGSNVNFLFPLPAPSAPTSNTGEALLLYKVFNHSASRRLHSRSGWAGVLTGRKTVRLHSPREVWLIDNPTSDSLAEVKLTRFASGLHEALGLGVQDNNTGYALQRPELTKPVAKSGMEVLRANTLTIRAQMGRVRGLPRICLRASTRQGRQLLHHFGVVGFGGGHQRQGSKAGLVPESVSGCGKNGALGLRTLFLQRN